MTKHSWFLEYCEKTTLPCIQYFTMKRRSLIEKSFWILIFVFMISITFEGLRAMVNVWINNPTVMFIENTELSIHEIPFPLITVCPSSQVRNSVWEKYMNTNSSYWDDLQTYRDIMTCSTNTYFHNLEQSLKEFIDYDLIKNLLHDCGINCSEVFKSEVKWQNSIIKNFCQFVQPTILGIFGLCYTVNMMPVSQMFNEEYYQRYLDFFSTKVTYVNTKKSYWNIEDGYSFYSNRPTLKNVIPARTSGVTYNHRLKLTLHTLDGDFLSCANLGIEGGSFLVSFVITFSNPAEYCSVSPRTYVIPDTYTKIQITPFVKKINSDLMWRSLEVRQCYLHNERKLTIFQQYSELNCNHECEINKTLSMCGCVMIEKSSNDCNVDSYMKKNKYFDNYYCYDLLGTNDLKICGPAKYSCALEAIHSTKMLENLKVCNCLPTCSTIEYEVSDTSHFDDWKYMKSMNLVQNDSRGATIELVFKKPYFTTYTSASILNLESLISNVGGLLSLFLGMNLINIFEILFILVKMFSNYIITLFLMK